MNKHIITFFALFITAFTASALDKYITDDLSIYVRRGPSAQYGLTGSLKSGDKVVVFEKSADGKYTRIQDEKDRISWIETEALSDQPSLKERLPALEKQLENYKQQIANIDQDKQSIIDDYSSKLDNANKIITNLETKYTELQRQFREQNERVESLTTQVDEKRQSLILTWFTYGGIVAGVGLLLGLLLPVIMPHRRKKDRWM